MSGRVVAIHIAPKAAAGPVAVESARAVAGRGLEGDRYFLGTGTSSHKPGRDRDITLIDVAQLAWLKAEHGLELTAAASRRNLAVEGVALADLVGREFSVGEVRLRGIRLCEPCTHLEKLTGLAGLRAAFKGRCGLRAEIVSGGVITAGSPVRA